MLRKFVACLLMSAGIVSAAEYRMVVPFAPGAQSDIAARQVAQAFERITGDKMVVESIPGADSIIGINHFKNTPGVDVLWTASSIVAYNPVVKDNLPYSNDDFDHIIYVGTSPSIWLVAANSKYKTISDVFAAPPEFVGSNSSVGELNTIAVNRQKKAEIKYVPFKGAPDVLINVVNNTLPAAMIHVNSSLIELTKAGKIHILGSSYSKSFNIDGVDIPSIKQKTGVQQFNGFVGLSLRPGLDATRAQALKRGLWAAVQDAETKQKLQQLYILPDSSNDPKWINEHYEQVRAEARLYSKTK